MPELFFALLQLVALIFIFTFHNYIKAYTAYKLGDDTPKRAGFLTLNPLPHIDPIGTLLLPGIFILLRSPLLLGWPRMVPVNYSRFPNPRKAALILAFVSILSYFFIAVLAWLLYKFLASLPLPYTVAFPLQSLFQFITIVSAFFGFLNLIPVPPMDMGIILFLLLGKNIEETYNYSLWGSLIILLLFMSGILTIIFQPVYRFLLSIF